MIIFTIFIFSLHAFTSDGQKGGPTDINKDWKYRMVKNVETNMAIRFYTEGRGLAAYCEFAGYSEYSELKKVDVTGEWMVANGTFNRPSKRVDCIYDFFTSATVTHEYDLFRYCAKGSFFQGRPYNDATIAKRDEILYLLEGTLICNQAGKVAQDGQLLNAGYEIALSCNNKLAQYYEKNSNGKFFLAAHLSDKRCNKGAGDRFTLQLEIIHFCSDRGMREKLTFSIPIGVLQVPEKVHEDTQISIDLTEGKLRRTTGDELTGQMKKA